MKRIIKLITPLLALSLAISGCRAHGRVGPIHGGGGIADKH